jgi:N-dimethylarginine dimethylaminohydrolase
VPGLLPRRVKVEAGDRVVVTGASGFIGHAARPARAAIRESARWFAGHGYVTARRLAAINWRE